MASGIVNFLPTLGFKGGLGQEVKRHDDNIIDRLNRRYTVAILVSFAVFVS